MMLKWHDYRYYPYEQDLASLEVAALFPEAQIRQSDTGLVIGGAFDLDDVKRLTYFSGFQYGQSFIPTAQSRLEGPARTGKNRQATRYSTHGLHEYKGKFNPQVAKSLLNIFAVHNDDIVFDPFCGSGTTLVECAHIGVRSFGIDMNPLAVYVANAKLAALAAPATELRSALGDILNSLQSPGSRPLEMVDNRRTRYLSDWFDPSILHTLETMRHCIDLAAGCHAPIFLAVCSNLLRDYSRQDPQDLRIRRRKSPLPGTPLTDAFQCAAERFLDRVADAQAVLDSKVGIGKAVVGDATTLTGEGIPHRFDAAITSPPYATALPYIDTHRLSLVWIDLLHPDRIHELESSLVGSRELRGESRRRALADLKTNAAGLPATEAAFCAELQQAIGPNDGFRRQAVPTLLYRYFAAMQSSFAAIRPVMRQRAPFGLLVGHNHTVLGGIRRDINTPAHLISLAGSVGWQVDDVLPLQSYQRYGYHMNNAVAAETLIILRA